MNSIWLIFIFAMIIIVAALVIAYICFRMAFYVPDRINGKSNTSDIPEGKIYEPYREVMEKWTNETKAMPYEEFSITTFDGLKLYAKYYEYRKGAPIELMFHGYRGKALRDPPRGGSAREGRSRQG